MTPLAGVALGVFIAAYGLLNGLAVGAIRRDAFDGRDYVFKLAIYYALTVFVIFGAAIYAAEEGHS